MYGELTLTFKAPMSRAKAVAELENMISGNLVTVQSAASGTPFATSAELALCAEQVPGRVTIIYFMVGSDTVVANILARSVSPILVQCERIARQLQKQGLKAREVRAAIHIRGADTEVLRGERTSVLSRGRKALGERFIGKFVPALVTVFLVSLLMAGTPAFKSAEIGLVAATVGALIDAFVVALTSETWKWREPK